VRYLNDADFETGSTAVYALQGPQFNLAKGVYNIIIAVNGTGGMYNATPALLRAYANGFGKYAVELLPPSAFISGRRFASYPDYYCAQMIQVAIPMQGYYIFGFSLGISANQSANVFLSFSLISLG